MSEKIENPAECEVRAVIRFLRAQNVRRIEIYPQLIAVYGEGVMNGSDVRSGVECLMRAGQTFMMSDPGARPSSLRTWKTGLINTSGQTGVPLLMEFMRTFPKFLVRWFMKFLRSICVKDSFNGLAADFYDAGIQKLVTRYDKCLNLHGDHVEKFKACSNDVKSNFNFIILFIFYCLYVKDDPCRIWWLCNDYVMICVIIWWPCILKHVLDGL
jgi:hypothetical protein